MKTNGRLVTCDRCGKTVFLKCTGEGECDGGFTRWNTFESLPEGWKFNVKVGDNWADLCPHCFEAYAAVMDRYMNEAKKFMEEENND